MVDNESINEGGSAADLAMTDCEEWIGSCSDAEECIQGLEDLKTDDPSDADESYANNIIDTYIDMVQNFGLKDVQDKLEADKNNEPDLPESELNEFRGNEVDIEDVIADALNMTYAEFRRAYPEYSHLYDYIINKYKDSGLDDDAIFNDSIDVKTFNAIKEEIKIMENPIVRKLGSYIPQA